ncbi:MAG: HDOD domain-containing protein [Phycisphaerae bacterium]
MPAAGLKRRKIELLLEDLDQVPTLPGLAHHVLTVATGEKPSRRDLQMALEADPALAAKALKFAVDLGRPADDLLSLDAVFETVPFSALTAEMLSTQAADDDLLQEAQLPVLWRHTLAVAMVSQMIATRLGTVSPETALLSGLLHDLGQIALRVLLPRAYRQVLDDVGTSGGGLLEAERNLLGIDHAVFGKRLAQRWGFPEVFQNVMWLHHQAQIPEGARPGVGSLAQVVRLADLLARQYGFGYYPSEQVRENPAEAAERLGLSGVQADHIGRHIEQAMELNMQPVGFDDHPGEDRMQQAYRAANARLGRIHRKGASQTRAAQTACGHAGRVMALNADLAARTSPGAVMERIADAIREALDCRVVVPYLVARDGGYVEGLRCTANGGVEDHFLYDLPAQNDLAGPIETGPPTAGPARAERTHAWLLDRQGPDLGPGPFYAVPMTVGDATVGGILFVRNDAAKEPDPHEADQAADLAGVAGIALRRAQAEADLVALSEELADANRRLEAAHRATLLDENVASLSEMATGAAHEINNPLAIISGRIQQLAADEQDPDRRKTLETVIQQAHRISEIIAELRAFAKPPPPSLDHVDPVALARRVADAQQPAEDAEGVRVVAVGSEQAPAIRVDGDQIADALGEAVRNGVQACARSGGGTVQIRVEALPAGAAVRFVITDDGPGMEPEIRARAFDPFYSGQETARRRGLGLSKAYRTIQMNAGKMALESTPGHGTTVRVTFPSAEAAQAATDAEPSDPNVPPGDAGQTA